MDECIAAAAFPGRQHPFLGNNSTLWFYIYEQTINEQRTNTPRRQGGYILAPLAGMGTEYSRI
jgi:hypothetical protein